MAVFGFGRSRAPASGYRDQPRPEMLPFLPAGPTGGKVLEIGCGEGVFAASIAGATEIWGIEPHAPSAAKAAEKLHVAIAGTYEGAKPKLPARYFDLVVCNDVIEHMADSDAFLRSIQDHMAPGAVLVGSVPNVRYYKNLCDLVLFRDRAYRDSGIMDRTHLRFFTLKSLDRSLRETGFRIERLGGIRSGIRTAWYPRSLAYSAFAYGLILLTLGWARDIRHVGLAFRATPET